MDDFEGDELYDDDYYNQVEEDDGESLKDKYDRAKDYKEKFDKYKDKYNDYKNNRANDSAKTAAKQGGKEATKETGKKAGEEIAKEAGKKATTEAGKQVAKEGAKVAAKEGAKVAAEGAAASTGVGLVVAAGIEVADRLNKLQKKVEKKLDNKIEETTGIKDASKKKKYVPWLLILAIIILVFVVPAMAMYAISETATSELTTLVRAREKNNDKKLIMFTKKEIKELLNKDIEVSEDIASKLAQEGYTLERKNGKYKSISYKNILKGYESDLTNIFSPTNLTGASDGMEDVLDDDTSYDSLNDKNVAVSLKNVKKYLMAEIDNFNNGVTWSEASLNVDYTVKKSQTFDNYAAYISNDEKVTSNGDGTLTSSAITKKDYTVKDDDNEDTLLKMPKLSEHGVNVEYDGGENKAAIKIVNMLEPYMQKWIIPYTIYIDTQDEDFVNSIMQYMYHPADVSIFKLKKLVKKTTFKYYMKCKIRNYNSIHYYDGTGWVQTDWYPVGDQIESNTKSCTPGKHEIYFRSDEIASNSCTIPGCAKMGYKHIHLSSYYVDEVDNEIATDDNGNPIVEEITVSRKLKDADSVAEISHVESFYEILNREYKITPINENIGADYVDETELKVNENTGIGTVTRTEQWNETVQMVESETTKYSVSYYTEEQMQNLGRDISRIEWYQDSNSLVSGGIDGGSTGTVTQSRLDYIEKYKAAAIEVMNESGVLASVTLAQGIIESRSGASTLTSVYHNHFGMKVGPAWSGNSVLMDTYETINGSKVKVKASFRAYDSDVDSFADRAQFLWNTTGHDTKPGGYRFRDCTNYAITKDYLAPDGEYTYNYLKAIEAIQSGGYATDPDYVNLNLSIINTYELYKLDREYCEWDGEPPEYATADSSGGGSGSSSSSSGAGETLYSYDDMYFAYYQIEQWYANSQGILSTSTIDTVKLPDGGFAWPVLISDNNPESKSIYKFYVSGHNGIDISTGNVSFVDDDVNLSKGENVVATHDGTVTKVQPVTDENTNAYIEIKTDDGNFKTKYCYLSEIYVSEGDTVTKNQYIGKIGNTGAKSGIHSSSTELFLHYEIYYKGQNMDPLTYYNISCNGEEVDNYDELDLSNISNPKEYKYESSKTYLGNGGAVVEFAAQYLGKTLAQMNLIRGTSFNDHWCAWFASWCLRECGIDVIECSNSNYCPTIWNETKGIKHPYGDGYVPHPGDIIMFYSTSKGRYNHIAIVSKVEDGVVYWIGGNQGGDCPSGSHVTENSSDDRRKSYITY